MSAQDVEREAAEAQQWMALAGAEKARADRAEARVAELQAVFGAACVQVGKDAGALAAKDAELAALKQRVKELEVSLKCPADGFPHHCGRCDQDVGP